jgi:hypothetical protein
MLVGREADIQQAEIFHALLAQRRAVLCDLLDEQAIKLGGAEGSNDTAGVRRMRLRIKEVGAELRDIDRMMLGLRSRLLGTEQPCRPSALPDRASSQRRRAAPMFGRAGCPER